MKSLFLGSGLIALSSAAVGAYVMTGWGQNPKLNTYLILKKTPVTPDQTPNPASTYYCQQDNKKDEGCQLINIELHSSKKSVMITELQKIQDTKKISKYSEIKTPKDAKYSTNYYLLKTSNPDLYSSQHKTVDIFENQETPVNKTSFTVVGSFDEKWNFTGTTNLALAKLPQNFTAPNTETTATTTKCQIGENNEKQTCQIVDTQKTAVSEIEFSSSSATEFKAKTANATHYYQIKLENQTISSENWKNTQIKLTYENSVPPNPPAPEPNPSETTITFDIKALLLGDISNNNSQEVIILEDI